MRKYASLKIQELSYKEYSIVPIRACDKYTIMDMRNAQIFHLRQKEPLTETQQDNYFLKVIDPLFNEEKPKQLLFSFLYNKECIGYGGLVHINWVDKHAEISFIIKPELEDLYFSICWRSFLHMIKQVSFEDIYLHKIFTYAFDLRPHLYEAVEAAGFYEEARLKEHCLFEGKFIDVVIHSHINNRK